MIVSDFGTFWFLYGFLWVDARHWKVISYALRNNLVIYKDLDFYNKLSTVRLRIILLK